MIDTLSVLYEADQEVTELGVDVPRWIDQDITTSTVAAVVEGGCDSGAYMPAVTYYQARETMGEHGDDILTYIEDSLGEAPVIDFSGVSWDGAACKLVSMAVELWCGGVQDELAELLEDEDDE